MDYIYCQCKILEQSCWDLQKVALIFKSNIPLKNWYFVDLHEVQHFMQGKNRFWQLLSIIKVFLVVTSIFKISDKNLKALCMLPRHSTNFHVFSILSLPFLKHFSFPLSYFRVTIAAMKRKPKQNAKPRRDFLCNDSGNQGKWERGTSNNENCKNFILKTHLLS